MKGILLRGIINAAFHALTLPLKLIVIIDTICYMAYNAIRYEFSFMEVLRAYARGMKASFLDEITWVKNGNCKDFDD